MESSQKMTQTDRKKVLFLITKATWGGAQRYVYDLAIHLPKEFEAVVVYGESGKLSEDLRKAGINTYQVRTMGRDVSLFSDIKSFIKILKGIRKGRPDVVHLNSSKAAALGALAAKLSGVKKIIFTVHGWPFKEDRNIITKSLIYFISWFTGFLSDVVIVVSKTDLEVGKKIRIIGERAVYIPIGIAAPNFLSREEAASALSLTGNIPRVVTIAELTRNKGIRYAIEAIADLRRRGTIVHYTVLGGGEEFEKLKEIADICGIRDQVTLKGFILDAANYLKAFDVFLLPSIKEGMPYVLLEAAEAGLPIITTKVVNPDIIEGYDDVCAVTPANHLEIAHAISETIAAKERELFPNKSLFPLSPMLEKTFALYR